jgi:Ca2+-binding RTX toxin-like protein
MRRSTFAALVCSAVFVLGGGVQVRQSSAGIVPEFSTCNGLQPTIELSNTEVVYGTGRADVILAINVEQVYGFGGDDSICTDNVEFVYAGSGNDYVAPPDPPPFSQCPAFVSGGPGADYIECTFEAHGDSGNDVLVNGDSLHGGPGNDQLDGWEFTFFCDGGSGRDTAVDCPPSVTVNVP